MAASEVREQETMQMREARLPSGHLVERLCTAVLLLVVVVIMLVIGIYYLWCMA